MIDLVIGQHHFADLQTQLLAGNVESCAVLLAHEVVRGDGRHRLLVREVVAAAAADYSHRSAIRAELMPQFVASISKKAGLEGYATVWVHSHLEREAPHFSATDTDGEVALGRFLRMRLPNVTHAALVISESGVCSRVMGTERPLAVITLGDERNVIFPVGDVTAADAIFDRQVRALGDAAQMQLGSMRVGIVGLGGTGSIVAQELAHLGVRDFVLIDPDVLESTNLNRVAGGTPAGVGRAKVDIAADLIFAVAPQALVERIRGDVTRTSVALKLPECDFLFGCTDSHGSRSVLQQIAYQYLIPCIDLGSTIIVEEGHVRYVHGRVQLLAPTFACLTCSKLLDPEEVRRDLMSAFERRADPYIQGARAPAPAVMSLNGTVSSLAVSMMLAVCAGFPAGGRHLMYDARRPSLRTLHVQPDPGCYVCSASGSYARGNTWPIFARQDDVHAD